VKNAEEIRRNMKAINIVFPNQLFEESKILENNNAIYLIEEYLFFNQYRFHKQKIAFHRSSMKAYQSHLQNKGKVVHYIESDNPLSDIRNFDQEIDKKGISQIHVYDPTDDWLMQRLKKVSEEIELIIYENQQFLNTTNELKSFFKQGKKSFFQTTFYKQQRKKQVILLDEFQQPLGGKWTYDSENRKSYPKGKIPPEVQFPGNCKYWGEAVAYTNEKFGNNPGELEKQRIYPINYNEARDWFNQFLDYRFHDFGVYEDAIVKEHLILNHSLLSPLLNVGLLLPGDVVKKTLLFAEQENIPINSTEGFIRQVIGWREFIRGMYEHKGRFSRTYNFWKFDRKIPGSFYNGTTGIEPVDRTIKKVIETGYCHHIERLMILGNFMLLCEFDPDEVYRWFMELFIDAYDWVMVPNVYGMCLFADGGTFATKPYISGSNYIRKMSNYENGEWVKIWDGLFWRFVIQHEDYFGSNPRTSMLLHSLNRMSPDKKNQHMENANLFIESKLDARTK
jgi:deoxyribodipyrimidine photolyase-related protein